MIDQRLITDSFQTPSLAGMGDLGQLFSSTNPSSWGVGEWAVLLGGGYLSVKLYQDAQSVGRSVARRGRKLKSSAKRTATSATSTLGTVAIIAGIGAAGYLIYSLSSQSS